VIHVMSWKPPQVAFDAKHLVRALFDSSTEEARLLEVAARGDSDIVASRGAWNGVLWLIQSTVKDGGRPVYSGDELAKLREDLPITWT
jgi:predicted nucleic acid-binding protein